MGATAGLESEPPITSKVFAVSWVAFSDGAFLVSCRGLDSICPSGQMRVKRHLVWFKHCITLHRPANLKTQTRYALMSAGLILSLVTSRKRFLLV